MNVKVNRNLEQKPPANWFTTDAHNVPLHALGVVDIAATEVMDNEILAHALTNVPCSEKLNGWAIKHSSDFINEYAQCNATGAVGIGTFDNPNHLLGTFPWLFPYGEGGFEVNWPKSALYDDHVQWALCYDDKQFQKDLYFVFQVFGVLQKHHLCASAALQVSKCTFQQFEHGIRSLTEADFHTASAEESAGKPFSNADMQSLQGNLTAVCLKVMGTDESHIKICSLIWGMCVKENLPSIWLTINLNDTQDHVAQVLCGHKIDLDKFDPDGESPLATGVSDDPYASAAYFHLIINAVLQTLLGIKGFTGIVS